MNVCKLLSPTVGKSMSEITHIAIFAGIIESIKNLLQVLLEPLSVQRALCQRQTSIPEMPSRCDTQFSTVSFLCEAMGKIRKRKKSD